MKTIKPPELGKRMRYSLLSSIVLLITFFITTGILIISFMSSRSRFLNYILVFVNIMEMPFFLITLYGFWLISRYLRNRLIEYSIYILTIIYVPFILIDSILTWLNMNQNILYYAISVIFILIDAIISIIFSVGIIQLRVRMGHYATLLGVALFFQSLISATVIFYLIGYFMNIVVYPLMALFFYRASKEFSIADLQL